jgi:hypothetical protein
MMFENPHEVHDWLAEQSNNSHFYMQVLHLHWMRSPSTEKRYLSILTKLADELQLYPFVVRDLILCGNWKNHLIGNAVAILQQRTQFEQDLAECLLGNDNRIASRLAAGFALLTNGKSVFQLENYLAQVDEATSPNISLATYAALKFIGNDKAREFELLPIFKTLQANDRYDCLKNAEIHYKYWQGVLAK